MREIEPWIEGASPGTGQRRRIIVTVRITVEAQPIPQAGNSVRKIQSRFAVSGIIGIGRFKAAISKGREVPRQRASCKRMANSSPDGCAGESNLKIFRRMKTDFLQVEERSRRKLVAR